MPSDDREWVRKTLEGDKRAFDHLVEKYINRAYWIAFRMVSSPEEAEDITQEAFLKAYRALKKFRSDSSFFTWFCTILTNQCRDSLRKKRFRSRFIYLFNNEEEEQKSIETGFSDPHWSSNPSAVMEQVELNRDLENALSKLPIRQRTIFVLRHFQDMKIKDIAKTLGISQGTVKTHLFRAVQCLRNSLSQESGGVL